MQLSVAARCVDRVALLVGDARNTSTTWVLHPLQQVTNCGAEGAERERVAMQWLTRSQTRYLIAEAKEVIGDSGGAGDRGGRVGAKPLHNTNQEPKFGAELNEGAPARAMSQSRLTKVAGDGSE
eukprot:2274147-Heterocapsa_arctica.AAC.3